MKEIRNAVKSYLIRDNNLLVIQYKDNLYYDIPGGKIEENETSVHASIREFKEETGIDIIKEHYIGKSMIELPNIIYLFDIYFVDEYEGIPIETENNYSMWMDIESVLNEPKRYASVDVVKYLEYNMKIKMICDNDNKVLKLIKY